MIPVGIVGQIAAVAAEAVMVPLLLYLELRELLQTVPVQ